MKTNFIIISFFFLSINSFAQTGLYVPQLAKFDTAMLNLMSSYNVPGGQLAITYQGRLVYNRGFGFANTATKDSVYPDNIFRIASVSKPVTAVACMKLFEQGLLNLDAQVFGSKGILNDAIYQNILDPRDTTITVRMLLQHSGGWNRNISGDPMFDAYNIATTMGVSSPPTASIVIRYMLSHKMLDFIPGTQSQYSNFGFCVLGRVIEKITGQAYVDYVRNNILLPLGITDMKLGFNLPANKLPNEVNYYDYPGAPLAYSIYNNSTLVPWPYGGFNVEFMDSHGGWVASCQDLLKLVCAFDRFNTRPDILSTATIDTMTKPSAHDPNYACGIAVNTYNNWWHIGSLPGTTSEIVRDGNGQLNWAILFNTRDQSQNINAAMDNLVWNVLPSITSWPSFDLFTTITGIRENQTRADMVLYPNPTADKLYVSFNSINQNKIDIEIYNATGQSIFINTYKTDQPAAIDLSHFSNGIFFVRAIDNKQRYEIKKIIVQHK
ncbi:MAG: T9SS type A sorting domain-containing protein [Sphingobacteriales bacterium]|nr:MAG: T9SS type A sorting domain-containing protein [Sphingobacteriales bacterium]